MPLRVSTNALKEVKEALRQYELEVEGHPRLARSTKNTYLLHSQNFVRWLSGTFEPGARLLR